MGLAHVQEVLARLYTDAVLRERFFTDPERVSEEFGLSVDERRQLARLSAESVAFFADSLKRKRLNEASKLLPLSRRVLGKQFDDLFQRYTDAPFPNRTKKHEVSAFSAFVEQAAQRASIKPRWGVDLLRYEAAWVEAANPTRRLIVRWFRYPVSEVARHLRRGEDVSVLSKQLTLAFWFRLLPSRPVRHLVVSLPRLTITHYEGTKDTKKNFVFFVSRRGPW